MKKIMVFETVDELLGAFFPDRRQGDDKPFIPHQVSLTKRADGTLSFVGDGASVFETTVTYDELKNRCMALAHVRMNP